jgi:hypothetical protein
MPTSENPLRGLGGGAPTRSGERESGARALVRRPGAVAQERAPTRRLGCRAQALHLTTLLALQRARRSEGGVYGKWKARHGSGGSRGYASAPTGASAQRRSCPAHRGAIARVWPDRLPSQRSRPATSTAPDCSAEGARGGATAAGGKATARPSRATRERQRARGATGSWRSSTIGSAPAGSPPFAATRMSGGSDGTP